MNNKKVFTIILILICLIISSFAFYKKNLKEKELILYGNIDIRQVNLAFRVGGRISEMKLEEGDNVKKGDLIAKIDCEPILNKLNQAKAQLEIAKINMDNANTYFKRNIELCKKRALSIQECDNIKVKKNQANANYEYLKSITKEAELSYNDTNLYSPSDGIVLVRVHENGAIVGAGTPIYTLSLNDKMWARTYINETDLGKVKLGTKVFIYTDSTEKIYNGHIGFISSVSEFTPKNIETTSLRTDLVYRVRIVIDDADDYLKQGMPITIKIK